MDVDEDDVIIEISSNEYQTSIYVPKSTLKLIAKDKDLLKRRIQDDTQTTIKCSKVRKDGAPKRIIEIKGAKHEDVYSARQQIKSIGSKESSQPTHFTCVKITDPTIKANFLKFKDEVSNIDKVTDTHKSAFMKPEKLHITFGVMCLPDDDSRSKAQDILADFLENVVKPIQNEYGKIEFKANGLELMKGNLANARVLYAKIESDPLQKIANGVAKSYLDAGLGKRESDQESVKLHMTLMNVKYVKPRKKNAKSFDATHIFDKHSEFNFGSQEVNKIHLVDMREKDNDGFYKCISTIEF